MGIVHMLPFDGIGSYALRTVLGIRQNTLSCDRSLAQSFKTAGAQN